MSSEIQKTALFCMFSLFNFSSIFQLVSWPHLPLCADAHNYWIHRCRKLWWPRGNPKPVSKRPYPNVNIVAYDNSDVLSKQQSRHRPTDAISANKEQRKKTQWVVSNFFEKLLQFSHVVTVDRSGIGRTSRLQQLSINRVGITGGLGGFDPQFSVPTPANIFPILLGGSTVTPPPVFPLVKFTSSILSLSRVSRRIMINYN